MELIWPILGGGLFQRLIQERQQIIRASGQISPSVAEVVAKTVRRMKCFQEFCRADAMRTFVQRNDDQFGKFNKGAKRACTMVERMGWATEKR
jgi:hypothetical protein